MQVSELVDQAVETLGSQAKVARAIGAQRSHVSEWRSGARPCPEDMMLKLARVSGNDPVATVLEVVRARLGRLATTSLRGLVGVGVAMSIGFAPKDGYAMAAAGRSTDHDV